jgi:deoxyribodipyrimidine photo-lyase
MREVGLVWFRNDLRVRDQAAISTAVENCKKVAFLYCLDRSKWKNDPLGFPKFGARRTRFLLESLINLRQNLRRLGNDLILVMGKAEEEIPSFCRKNNIQHVYCTQEVTSYEVEEEQRVEKELASVGAEMHRIWDHTLYHLEDLHKPVAQIPDIFSSFRKENEKYSSVRDETNLPSSIPGLDLSIVGEIPKLDWFNFDTPETHSMSALDFKGGEDAGWERLNDYFWKKNLLRIYKETRNGLIGGDYSSKFSPWLSFGCISPRAIYHEVKRYEKEIKKNSSTYWLVFELIWRDYFRFVAKKYGSRIFLKGGIKGEPMKTRSDMGVFEKWRTGETGVPFIDANMKELLLTGFMSNRGRQNVASFLVKDLNLDWRWGARWFESQLIDYDVCSNWGNWMYVAGVGNDPRENRYFNILRQATNYDPRAEYVKKWIPELEELESKAAHAPSLYSSYGISTTYKHPLVDMSQWE